QSTWLSAGVAADICDRSVRPVDQQRFAEALLDRALLVRGRRRRRTREHLAGVRPAMLHSLNVGIGLIGAKRREIGRAGSGRNGNRQPIRVLDLLDVLAAQGRALPGCFAPVADMQAQPGAAIQGFKNMLRVGLSGLELRILVLEVIFLSSIAARKAAGDAL